MKNLQINESSIGAQEYNLVELVGDTVNVFQKQLPGLISSDQATAADYCLYDKSNDKLIIVKGDTDLSNYSIDKYTPIGVVVVPGTHNVYGDSSCGVMSLKEMNYNSPDTGSTSYQYIYWGQYYSDLSLPNLNQIPTGNSSNGIPTGQTSYAYLPSDNSSGTQCAHDSNAYYNNSPYIPSPYLSDGSRNPGYYQTTSPSSTSNALSGFDGIGNSQVLWDQATADSDWRTVSSISNDFNNRYSPAACCCWRYHTSGTKQGDWYLPACGELGYMIVRLKAINAAISKLVSAYGSSFGVTVRTGIYWSSSEYSKDKTWVVSTSNSYVSSSTKKTEWYTRAFLRVNQEGKPVNS